MPETTNEYFNEKYKIAKTNGFTCVEAEENILRRMVSRKGVADEVLEELTESDFSEFEYGKVFRAIQSLSTKRKQIDLPSIDAELTSIYGENGWKSDILFQIARETDFTISSWQKIGDLVKLVRNLALRRHAIAKIDELIPALRDPTKDIAAVLTELSDTADGINLGEAGWLTMGDVLRETFSYIERRYKGETKVIPSGLKPLDKIIGGFFEGEMTIIAARPSVGKSAFGANIAITAAKSGFKVGIISCEMPAIGLGQRFYSHDADIDGMKLRKADVDDSIWEKLSDSLIYLSNLPIQFMFDCTAIEDVVSAVRKKVRKNELDIVIVDYLQFMDTRKQFREERHRIGYISHNLKTLARKANIPVIALAQVTRAGEGTMPTMKMLRESGNIEQDADGIIFLHRPDAPDDSTVNPDDKGSLDVWKNKGLTYLSIGVAKQRNGSIGQTNVLFKADTMHYVEIARGE